MLRIYSLEIKSQLQWKDLDSYYMLKCKRPSEQLSTVAAVIYKPQNSVLRESAGHYLHLKRPEVASWTPRKRRCRIRYMLVSVNVRAGSSAEKIVS